MMCPTCKRRRIAKGDTVCRTCRKFIADYIDTGAIPRRTQPMVADVLLAMRRLGIGQDRAVIILGGTEREKKQLHKIPTMSAPCENVSQAAGSCRLSADEPIQGCLDADQFAWMAISQLSRIEMHHTNAK